MGKFYANLPNNASPLQINISEALLFRTSHVFVCVCVCVLFLAVLGLRCCTQAFSSCGERGLLFVAVRGLLIAVTSLVAEHRL